MHSHAERQYQAPLGVARVRTAGTCAVPTAGSWSFITPNAGMKIDPKTPRPRHPVTSP